MTFRTKQSWRSRIHLAALLAGFGVGCGVSSDLVAPGASDATLANTYAALTHASGTLVCTPGEAQIADCDGLAVGEDCTLVSSDGTKTWPGTCRATVDGATIACAPNPPAPPAELVAACAGLAAGDACESTDKLGTTHEGVCVTGKDGATLLCGRKMKPPAEATAACADKAAGDECTVTGTKKTFTGVCSLGPAGTGTLACTHARDLVSPAEKACAGLEAGAECTLGKKGSLLAGNCVVPASGDAALCVLPCVNVSGRFDYEGSRDADGGLYARGNRPSGGRSPPGGGSMPPLPPPGGSTTPPGGAGGGGGASGTGGGSSSTNSCYHHNDLCNQACSNCHR